MKSPIITLQSNGGNLGLRINHIIDQLDDLPSNINVTSLTFVSSREHPLTTTEYATFAENFPQWQLGGDAYINFQTDSTLGNTVKLILRVED